MRSGSGSAICSLTFTDSDKIKVSHENSPSVTDQPPVHFLSPLQFL